MEPQQMDQQAPLPPRNKTEAQDKTSPVALIPLLALFVILLAGAGYLFYLATTAPKDNTTPTTFPLNPENSNNIGGPDKSLEEMEESLETMSFDEIDAESEAIEEEFEAEASAEQETSTEATMQ